MEEGGTTSANDLETWDRLLSEQTALFKKTSARNVDLEVRVEELEREVSVWKTAMRTADEEKKTLCQNITRLERNIGSLKEDHPLIVCLIDGDGHIFSPELYSLGKNGGLQAAMHLTKAITEYLTNNLASETNRGTIWLTIFCNKSGLSDTLVYNKVCTPEDFEAFCIGFNQASPLFSMIDAGGGKEAADSKIKEFLRVFTRFPQTVKVIFGGAHDNGYMATLNQLGNEGLLEKVILLLGYERIAREIQNFNLPTIDTKGIFITRRMKTNKKSTNLSTLSAVRVEDFEKFRIGDSSKSPESHRSRSPIKPKQLDPSLPLHRQKPQPCNYFYLSNCLQGSKCRYGHDYVLLPEQIRELRDNAKNWPCPWANKAVRCPYGRSCCMAHYCPKGEKCPYAKQGKCKFLGARMHNQAQGGASGTEDDRSHTSSATGTQGESCSPSQFEATLPSSFGKSTYGRGSDHPETSNDQRVEYTGLAMVESGND